MRHHIVAVITSRLSLHLVASRRTTLGLIIHRGIATRLMRCSQLCMQEAFEARYVSLHVRESNRAAFHLYKTTLGYKVSYRFTTLTTSRGKVGLFVHTTVNTHPLRFFGKNV